MFCFLIFAFLTECSRITAIDCSFSMTAIILHLLRIDELALVDEHGLRLSIFGTPDAIIIVQRDDPTQVRGSIDIGKVDKFDVYNCIECSTSAIRKKAMQGQLL